MPRKRSSQTIEADQIDRDIETATSLGRIEGKLDAVSSRMDRFEQTTMDRMKSHEDNDIKRFDQVIKDHTEKFEALDKKIDDVLSAQHAMSGGWKAIGTIVTLAGVAGAFIVQLIHWVTGH